MPDDRVGHEADAASHLRRSLEVPSSSDELEQLINAAIMQDIDAIMTFARKLEPLAELNDSNVAAVTSVELRMRALEDRMTHLEENQGHLVVEAKAAAAGAATGLAGSVVADLATRVTRIEMRHDELLGRLPPPR